MKLESPLGSDLARLVRIWRALIDHRLKPLELTQTHWVTGNDSNLLIVFYVQIMPDDFVMQLHR
ncbi:hypothetical protein RNO38_07010, partial [Escherichia coli]|nr:hypothetical protein [Escherichia coli]